MSIDGGPGLHALIRARDGAACIYAEKQWIVHARMSIALLTETQLDLKFSNLSSPGFTLLNSTWEAGVALSEFRFAPDYWMGSPYLAWIIAFDPQTRSSLIAAAHAMQNRPAEERAFALRGQLADLIWPELTGSRR